MPDTAAPAERESCWSYEIPMYIGVEQATTCNVAGSDLHIVYIGHAISAGDGG
jgi:hypothetical protein